MSSGHRHGDEKAASAVADKYFDSAAKLVAACTVVDTFDVPWLANRSTDGKTVYRDKRVPEVLKCGIDTSLSLPWHELPEWEAMNDGMLYDTGTPSAHVDVATPLERREVERQKPDDPDIWSKYSDEMDGFIREVDDASVVCVPLDMDLRPFKDDDRKLLEEIIAAQADEKRAAVVLVAGPPCAGKTTHVLSQMGTADMVVDVDRLTRALTGRASHDRSKGVAKFVFAAQRAILGRLGEGNQLESIYVTALMPKAEDREAFQKQYSATCVLIMPSKEECLRRLESDQERPEEIRQELVLAIEKWFADYSPSQADQLVAPQGDERLFRIPASALEHITHRSFAPMPKIYTPADLLVQLKAERDAGRDAQRLFVDDKGARIAKAIGVQAELAIADAERAVDFVISTGSIDRYNSTIAVKGWQTENYQKNSVILWAHDDYIPAIGRAETTRIDGNRLVSRGIFATRDVHPLADTVYSLIKAKFINAASVGWIPLKWQFVEDKDRGFGIDYLEQELLEWSVVNIPANPECLVDARSMGIDTKPLLAWAEHTLDTGGMLMIPRKELEALRKAADASTSVAVSRVKFIVDTAELTDAIDAIAGVTRAGKAISKKNMDTIKKAHEHASAGRDRCQAACDHLQGMIDDAAKKKPDDTGDDDGNDDQDPEQAALKLRKLRAGLLKLKASPEIIALVDAAFAPTPKS